MVLHKEDTTSRRGVMKGLGVLGAGALGAGAFSSTGQAVGEQAVYQYYHTDWQTITSNLSTIADQGYGAIQVPPAQYSRLYEYERQYSDEKGYYTVPLGYQPIDYRNFNSVFGTESEYKSMVDEAHRQGLDVIADAVTNHICASGFDDQDPFERTVPMEDVPYFSDADIRPDTSCNYDTGEVQKCWLAGLRDLKQEDDYVRGELYRYIQKYADMGVDGIRWDAAKHIQDWYFSEHANVWADQMGLYSVGEVFDNDVDKCMKYANTGMSVTDFPLYNNLQAACAYNGDMNALGSDAVVERDGYKALTFVNNHDSASPDLPLVAYAYILTYEGYPRVYSNEIGIDDAAIRNLLWIRNNLASGEAFERYSDQDVYAFERYQSLLTALNNTSDWQSRWMPTSWREQSLNDYTGDNNAYVNSDGWVQVDIPPQGYVVLA